MSDPVSIYAATIPSQPLNLQKLSSDESQITVMWSLPTDNGGSLLLDYKLYWDMGVQNGQMHLLDLIMTEHVTYTVINNLQQG